MTIVEIVGTPPTSQASAPAATPKVAEAQPHGFAIADHSTFGPAEVLRIPISKVIPLRPINVATDSELPPNTTAPAANEQMPSGIGALDLQTAAPVADATTGWDVLQQVVYDLWSVGAFSKLGGLGWQSAIGKASDGTAQFGAGVAFATAPMVLYDMTMACKGLYEAGQASRDVAATLRLNEAGHQAFIDAMLALKNAPPITNGTHAGGADGAADANPGSHGIADASQQICSNLPAFLAYEGAAQKELNAGRKLDKAVVVFLRDFVAQGGSLGAGVVNAGNVIAHGLAGANTVAGVVGGSFALAGSALQIVAAHFERRNAKATIQNANEALKRVAPMHLVGQPDPSPQASPPPVSLRAMATLANPTMPEKIAKVTQFLDHETNAGEAARLARLYGAIDHHFTSNQQKAIADARLDKRHATVRKWFGVTGVTLGATALMAGALGAATLGVALAISGAVAGGLFLGYTGLKLYRNWRNNKAAHQDDVAQRDFAQATIAKLSSQPAAGNSAAKAAAALENQFVGDAALRGNKYLAAYLLTAHLVDRSDAGNKSVEDNPVRLKRKLATRYLLTSGMDRNVIRALKEVGAANTEAAMKNVYTVIHKHLLGDSARLDRSESRSGWTNFLNLYAQ